MDIVPSILMLAWNRLEYFEKTITHLLKDPSDFRLYIWDNGSKDGVSDLIGGLIDDRIVARHHSPTNVGQGEPWHWFLNICEGEIAGKLDDDILGERGWMTRFAKILAAEPRFGTLGAWVYLESDWDPQLANHKIQQFGEYQLFVNPWVPGGIFLGRKAVLQTYSPVNPQKWGIPLEQIRMFQDGFINGYPLPLSFAEHMDDPRSPHCRMNRPGGWDEFAAYSARQRNFTSPEEYGQWIAQDARSALETPLAVQIKQRLPSLQQRLKRLFRTELHQFRIFKQQSKSS